VTWAVKMHTASPLGVKAGDADGVHILNDDNNQIGDCWKCLTIAGMTMGMHGHPKEALEDF